MRSAIEQHLRAEADSGTATLEAHEFEGLATWAYRSARLAHSLAGEIAAPSALARGLGLGLRPGRPVPKYHAVRVGEHIVYPHGERRETGATLLHETAHAVLDGSHPHHTHADVIALTLCLAAPWETMRSAMADNELTLASLMERQRHAPAWLLRWRFETIAGLFDSIEVA